MVRLSVSERAMLVQKAEIAGIRSKSAALRASLYEWDPARRKRIAQTDARDLETEPRQLEVVYDE